VPESRKQKKWPHRPKSLESLRAIVDEVRAELRKRRSLGAKALADEIAPSEARTHSVYVVELDRAVLDERSYAEESPRARDDRPCLYVGMTCLSAEERFEQHRTGEHASKYVKRYGLRLRPEFYERLNPMTRRQAERTERALAKLLKREGYAAWQR